MKLNEIKLVQIDGMDYDIPEYVHSINDAVRTFETAFSMSNRAQELFCIISLDTKNRIVGIEECMRGDDEGVTISMREIFKRVLLHNASSFILAHNHPSGDPRPSVGDLRTTEAVRVAAQHLDVELVDHIVISGGKYLSVVELLRKVAKNPKKTHGELENSLVREISS